MKLASTPNTTGTFYDEFCFFLLLFAFLLNYSSKLVLELYEYFETYGTFFESLSSIKKDYNYEKHFDAFDLVSDVYKNTPELIQENIFKHFQEIE